MRSCPGTGLGLALLLVTAGPALALDPSRAVTQYRYQSWNTRDGLPQSSVEAVVQTRDGYLWLGTQEGLARFDGVAFTVFDRSNTRELRHNRVVALHEDSSSNLWIGTQGGGLTRLRAGVFETFAARDGLPSDRVTELASDGSGRLWVGTDEGLVAWENEHAVGSVLLAGEAVRALECARDGSVWVGTRRGLYRAAGLGASVAAVAIPGEGTVSALWLDDDGSVWAGRTRGVVRWRGGETSLLGPAAGLHGLNVVAIRRDRQGSLWVGSEGGGLARLRGRRFESFTSHEGLANDLVLRILEGREGHLWIGMQDGGLARLSDSRFLTWTTREGLAGDVVWPVFGDREGALWVGTSTGGISRMRNGEIRGFTTRDGLASNSIQAFAQDASGALWIGTRGGGLQRYADGHFTRFTTRDGLPGDSVKAVLADRDGSLWVGTRDNGLARRKSGRFASFGPADGFTSDSVHTLLQDRFGAVWIGTDGQGLVRYSGGRFSSYTTRDGLSADIVNCLLEDEDGTLWIGTYGGGLNRLRGGRLTAYTSAQGLFDDAIFSILDDGAGSLWMSCNKGIFKVARKDLEALDRGELTSLRPTAYGVEDGMRNRECNGANHPSGWRDATGRLFFPTVEGLVEIDPKRLGANPLSPPVVIEKLVVDGRPVMPRDGLVFRPGSESFEIQYAGLSFGVPERVRFRYRLEGLDRDWLDVGTRRSAYFTRIPPGEYRFRVAAANEDGVWNEEGASLSFRLRPHFYRTSWFTGVAALGAVGMIAGGYRLRERRQRRREATLVRLVEQRTQELEEANRRLEKLSMLDGLTGVANRRRFDEALDVEWRRACRSGLPLSLMLVDVDSFKLFNDTHGHLEGDACLRRVAETLSASLSRAADLAARFGGEEFVSLLPHTSTEEAAGLAERLRARVEALAIPHPSSPVTPVVTVSIGCATAAPSEDGDPAALLAAADAALYAAKRAGRNRVVSSRA